MVKHEMLYFKEQEKQFWNELNSLKTFALTTNNQVNTILWFNKQTKTEQNSNFLGSIIKLTNE